MRYTTTLATRHHGIGPHSAAVTVPGIACSPTRVIIVDDHPLFLAGLRAMLSAIPNTEVVAEATTGAAAVDAARRHDPDIVLMDLDMPVMNGVEATRRIVNECPGTRVLVLTMLGHRDRARDARLCGRAVWRHRARAAGG
jgi:DNA-binding NarL/FixJ family response regulator